MAKTRFYELNCERFKRKRALGEETEDENVIKPYTQGLARKNSG